MGLDIRAYSEVELLEEVNEMIYIWERIEELESEDLSITTFYINTHFPLQGEGIVRGVYSYKNSDSVGFRIGYSGWSLLRNSLAKSCGYPETTVSEVALTHPSILDQDNLYWRNNVENLPYQQSAFMGTSSDRLHYLLNFSDCEGVINTGCCKTIYQDLLWLKQKDKENPCIEDVFMVKFNQLIELFKFAAENNGVVKFH